MDPQRFQLRVATEKDAEGIARVNINTWKSSLVGVIDADFLNRLNVESRVDAYRKRLQDPTIASFVVEDVITKKIVAQSDLGPSREKNLPIEGEIYSIYILKEYHGLKIGRALFTQCRHQLASRNFKDFFVSVIVGNDPAIEFYRRMGGKLYGHDHVDLGGKRYPTDTYAWTLP